MSFKQMVDRGCFRGGAGPRFRRLFAASMLALVVLGSGCSSTGTDSTDDWARSYLDPPDRVWEAIHLSLDELGYQVEKEDRFEGTIRAAPIDDQPYRGVVLKIDQIMRTDIVRVSVHAGSGGSSQHDFRRMEAAASEFLAVLDVKLGGWSEGRAER